MNHFIIKLTSGEFVYGMINPDTVDNKMIIVNNPLVWEDYINENGEHSSTLVKFCTSSIEEDVPISSSAIVSILTMSLDFIAFYDNSVSLQKIIEESYNKRLKVMTARIHEAVSEHYANIIQNETGDLVGYYPYLEDTNNTYH